MWRGVKKSRSRSPRSNGQNSGRTRSSVGRHSLAFDLLLTHGICIASLSLARYSDEGPENRTRDSAGSAIVTSRTSSSIPNSHMPMKPKPGSSYHWPQVLASRQWLASFPNTARTAIVSCNTNSVIELRLSRVH